MADISQEIAAFQSAKYGEQVRSSMVSLAEKINDEVEQTSDDVDGFNVTIGTVETLEPDEVATVTNTGTQFAPVLNFGIPRGNDGGVSGDISQNAVNFPTASTRQLPTTGEALRVIVSKIVKWLSDLATGAFAVVYNALDMDDPGYVLDARQGKILNDSVATKAEKTYVDGLLNGAIMVQSLQIANSQITVAAGGHSNDITVTPTAYAGYTPILATPRNTGGNGMLNFYRIYMNSSRQVVVTLSNPRTVSVSTSSAYVNVLYIKDDLA